MDWSPLWISLKTSAVSGVLTFFLGLGAAWLVGRIKSRTFGSLIDALFTLPLVLPPTVAGFFLLYIFGVYRPIGSFLIEYLGVRIAFSWEATVIASFVISFPLMYRSARAALCQVNPDLAAAARTIGMSEWSVFWRVIFPAARPGILSGGILAYVRGLGEFGATSMIAGNIAGQTRTLPLAVYSEVAAGNMDKAGDYVLVLAAAALFAVLLMGRLDGEKKYD